MDVYVQYLCTLLNKINLSNFYESTFFPELTCTDKEYMFLGTDGNFGYRIQVLSNVEQLGG